MSRTKPASRSLNEEIKELEAKIKLLDGEQKAYNENAGLAEKECKRRIIELRRENNRLRCQLRDRLSADDHVINQAFQNKPVERAMLSNKPTHVAIETMDYKVCDGIKRLNALRYQNTERQKRLDHLKYGYDEYCKDSAEAKATLEGANKEGQRLRDLENRLDKAVMKAHEADHIKTTYEKIKSKLEEEHLQYGNNLDDMEREIKRCREEIKQLRVTEADALKAKEAAVEELHKQEDLVYVERRQRDVELKNMREEADEKKLLQEKFEKRIAGRESAMNQEESRNLAIVITEEQQRKITNFEEAFKVIKEATGVSDLEEVVLRFENQGDTKVHLEELKKNAETNIALLREEKDRLEDQYKEMKYTGETKMSNGEKVLEEYKDQVDTEEKRREKVLADLERTNRTLILCRSGSEHLFDKLRSIRNAGGKSTQKTGGGSSTQIDSGSDEFVLDLLSRSEEKLLQLLEQLSSQDIEAQINKMRQEDFQNQIEKNIPSHNVRVKLPAVQKDTVYEDEEESDDDDDVQTRNDIKNQSKLIVEMKTKKRSNPKKKKKMSKAK